MSLKVDVEKYFVPPEIKLKSLRRLLLAWDGQWFLKIYLENGINKAIELNRKVRASFGKIEMKTILKFLGKKEADDFLDALKIILTYSEIFFGEGLKEEHCFRNGSAEVKIYRCPAFEGVKKAGLERIDQACIACESLWKTWIKTLLPKSNVEVEFIKRKGFGDALCQIILKELNKGFLKN